MSERYGRDEEDGYVADMSITETIDGVEYGEEVEDVVAELNALNVRAERAEEFARVCNAKTQSYLEQLAVEMARVEELEEEIAVARKALLWYAYACLDQDELPEIRAAYNAAERALRGEDSCKSE
jgi:hypothetical protein